MTKEEAFKKLEETVGAYLLSGHADDTTCGEWREIFETLKRDQAADLCEDAISRKALMSHIESERREWGEDYDLDQLLGDIEDFSSVTPTREHGEWIYHHRTDLGEKLNDMCECSKCGKWFSISELLYRSFCPSCGADMRKEQK